MQNYQKMKNSEKLDLEELNVTVLWLKIISIMTNKYFVIIYLVKNYSMLYMK